MSFFTLKRDDLSLQMSNCGFEITPLIKPNKKGKCFLED